MCGCVGGGVGGLNRAGAGAAAAAACFAVSLSLETTEGAPLAALLTFASIAAGEHCVR